MDRKIWKVRRWYKNIAKRARRANYRKPRKQSNITKKVKVRKKKRKKKWKHRVRLRNHQLPKKKILNLLPTWLKLNKKRRRKRKNFKMKKIKKLKLRLRPKLTPQK